MTTFTIPILCYIICGGSHVLLTTVSLWEILRSSRKLTIMQLSDSYSNKVHVQGVQVFLHQFCYHPEWLHPLILLTLSASWPSQSYIPRQLMIPVDDTQTKTVDDTQYNYKSVMSIGTMKLQSSVLLAFPVFNIISILIFMWVRQRSKKIDIPERIGWTFEACCPLLLCIYVHAS